MFSELLLLAAIAIANPAGDIQGEFTAQIRSRVETDRVVVRGWAVSRCGPPELTLTVDGHELARARPWMPDATVAARFPPAWGSERPAFVTEIDPLHYAAGVHRIRIEAAAAACGARAIGERTFLTPDPAPEWLAWLTILGLAGGAWGVAVLLALLPRGTHRVPLGFAVPAILVTSVAAILLGLPSIGITGGPPFAPLGNWDGQFYLGIARDGYGTAGPVTFGFFPLLPLVLRVLDALPVPIELAAALLNALLFAASIRMLRRLLPDGDGGLLAYAALPYAFFFVAVYTESLALFFSVLFVTLLRAKRGVPAFLAGAMAGLTRLPCLALVVFAARDARERRPSALAVLGPLAGAAAFAVYLWISTGDPLRYAHSQQTFGRASSFSAGRLLQVLWRACRTDDRWGWVDLCALAIVMVGACMLARARRTAEGIFSAAVVLIPLASLSVASIHRYALLAFPVFPHLAGLFRNRWAYWALIAAELWFLVVYALHFGRQNFVG